MLANLVLWSVGWEEDECSGCGIRRLSCPLQVIELQPRDGKRVSHANERKYNGCGTCDAACPSEVIAMYHFADEQILAQVEALLSQVN